MSEAANWNEIVRWRYEYDRSMAQLKQSIRQYNSVSEWMKQESASVLNDDIRANDFVFLATLGVRMED